MFEQINSSVMALSKSFADAAFKAQSLALENFEKLTDLHVKTLENRVSATQAFFTEAFETRDMEGAKAFWPKSVGLVKESSEKMYATGQEAFGIQMKASEAFGQLAKDTFETANQNFANQVAVVKNATVAATQNATAAVQNAAANVQQASKAAK